MLSLIRNITGAWTVVVLIEIIRETAAIALVQTRPGKLLTVLDVRRAAKSNFFAGIKAEFLQGINDSDLQFQIELGNARITQENANGRQIPGQALHIRRRILRILRQPQADLVTKRSPAKRHTNLPFRRIIQVVRQK